MNTNYQLPVWETMQITWQKVRGAKKSIWGAYGWLLLVAFVFGVLASIAYVKVIFAVISPLVITVLGFGVMRIGIFRALDKPIAASMIFYPIKQPKLMIKLLLFWLLIMLVMLPFVIIGMLASTLGPLLTLIINIPLGIVGIYLMVRLRLGWGFILDKEVRPLEALKLSFNATRHNVLPLIILYVMNVAILIIGSIPFGIGLIWAIPYVLINYGVAYRKLMEQ